MSSTTLNAPAVARETAPPDIKAIYRLMSGDFDAVNALIPQRLTSDVALVEQIGRHIIDSGGKRLRPLLVLMTARCLGYNGSEHIKLAAIIEFLHTATLLHDDVVDRSDLRRGRATANQLWGNAPSVLVGDFLYSRAFQLMAELGRLDIISILSDATNVIAEGEVQQLANVGNADLDETQYFDVIRAKTAMLFQAASHSAAVLASCDEAQIVALRDFGLTLGLAYQLVDDWLDYAGDPAVMGKNAGDDLAEGKVTLPLIHTLQHGSTNDRQLVREAIETRSSAALGDVVVAVKRCGALDRTREDAEVQARRAIDLLTNLPGGEYRDALADLARFCVAR
ncbi:MAG TPA: polyprenyl synthetase family protein, partial [Pseudomonadales bacterium]